ncbi:MAG: alpha/beta hydrolase [Candidatus Anammoximicrobium sp.]|nr:alpha/beta hydrolase [Candidatus Anammoximicrobium sp.]
MRRTFLSWLTDRLILCPTRQPIEATDKTRRWVPCGDGRLEIWTQRVGDGPSVTADLYVLKFPGTAGRAERSTAHPADAWPGMRVELWSVNPPGYGGSSGTASLRQIATFADAAWEELQRETAGRPVVLTGSSLGCVAALYLAASRPVAGLILRNPPPLREVILARFGRRTLYVGARLIARQLPPELDAIRNAAAARAPAVFLSAQRDRVVPVACQQRILDAYQGPQRALRLAEADHHTPLTDVEAEQYRETLVWLRQQMMPQREMP